MVGRGWWAEGGGQSVVGSEGGGQSVVGSERQSVVRVTSSESISF